MRILKVLFHRVSMIVVAAIAQVLIWTTLIIWFGEHAEWIEVVIRVLSLSIVLALLKNSKHLSTDIIWIIVIVAFPIP